MLLHKHFFDVPMQVLSEQEVPPHTMMRVS
jgi:hypothetical protein